MFRQIAETFPGRAAALIQLHPMQLVSLLEEVWNARSQFSRQLQQTPGHPQRRSDIIGLPIDIPITNSTLPAVNVIVQQTPRWHHLIYAYMIENTRIYEIFKRAVYELLHGEKFGVAQVESQNWLRNTELLFYKDSTFWQITALDSHIRSDLRATRRNAYYRMFGMDLNHGTDDGKPYPFAKADISNREFVSTFEELLREIWVGIYYYPATSAPNPTDNDKIANLAQKLSEMLIARRRHGNLSREEFTFVSMMDWFHLTISNNLPIIVDLRAEAPNPAQRLFKIAQSVGLPAHKKADSFFQIADNISNFLVDIEEEEYNNTANT